MNGLSGKELQNYVEDLPGIAVYKDEQGVYLHLNARYGQLIGMKQHLDIIGGTDFDIPCGAAACAEIFREQDSQVRHTGLKLQVLDIHPYANDQWRGYVTSKTPWLDANKQVVGTLVQGMDITDAYAMMLSTQLAKFTGQPQTSFTLSDVDSPAHHGVSLTPRESEVLFLILRGKTAKLTALALGLSFRTVEQYLETIKLKFGVHSRAELFDVAMARGYMSQIPVSIFSKQLSIVLAAD